MARTTMAPSATAGTGPFLRFYQSHFSPQSGRAMKVSYMIMVVIVVTYTLIVLVDGVLDTCTYPRNRKMSKDTSVTFLNPEFDARGGCLRRRFWFLCWLTPEECMLCRRILISVVLGMLIGFERRRADRPAGVRTMALVSLGSCIFTIDSMFAFSNSPDSWDSSRVAAAIPSGVGFLGAGLIYKRGPRTDDDRHEVHGLTTASSVWLSAAAGIAAGGGLAVIAFFSTMVMIIVLRFGPRLPIDGGEAQDSDDDHHHHHRSDPEQDSNIVEDYRPTKKPTVPADLELGETKKNQRRTLSFLDTTTDDEIKPLVKNNNDTYSALDLTVNKKPTNKQPLSRRPTTQASLRE